MGAVIGPMILGVLLLILGFFNRRGHISSLHWYHRRRVTEENRLPFGRLVGLGTMIIGGGLVAFGGLTFAAQQTETALFAAAGEVVAMIGLVAGLGLSFYAMTKYNGGLF
mgnify:CR=1 FL=1